MAEEDEELTEEEQLALQSAIVKYGSPQAEVKHNTHTFLKEVLDTKDTSKVGFLSGDELGIPSHPVRVLKELALFSNKVLDNPFITEYFNIEAENTFASSLSREGFLDKLAVIQVKKNIDEQKIKNVNKSWFKKKEKTEGETQY